MEIVKIGKVDWPEDIIRYSLSFFPRAALRKAKVFDKNWNAAAKEEILRRLQQEEIPFYFTYGEPIIVKQSSTIVPVSDADIYTSFTQIKEFKLFQTEQNVSRILNREAQLESGGLFAIIRRPPIFKVLLSECIKNPSMNTISLGNADISYQIVAKENVTPISGVLQGRQVHFDLAEVELLKQLRDKQSQDKQPESDASKSRWRCAIL